MIDSLNVMPNDLNAMILSVPGEPSTPVDSGATLPVHFGDVNPQGGA